MRIKLKNEIKKITKLDKIPDKGYIYFGTYTFLIIALFARIDFIALFVEEEKKEYEDVCFICRRPESKAGKMYHLPNNICVCDDCMHRTMDAVSQYDYQGMLNNPELMNMLNN